MRNLTAQASIGTVTLTFDPPEKLESHQPAAAPPLAEDEASINADRRRVTTVQQVSSVITNYHVCNVFFCFTPAPSALCLHPCKNPHTNSHCSIKTIYIKKIRYGWPPRLLSKWCAPPGRPKPRRLNCIIYRTDNCLYSTCVWSINMNVDLW